MQIPLICEVMARIIIKNCEGLNGVERIKYVKNLVPALHAEDDRDFIIFATTCARGPEQDLAYWNVGIVRHILKSFDHVVDF